MVFTVARSFLATHGAPGWGASTQEPPAATVLRGNHTPSPQELPGRLSTEAALGQPRGARAALWLGPRAVHGRPPPLGQRHRDPPEQLGPPGKRVQPGHTLAPVAVQGSERPPRL